jgi:hypothetical protein
VPFLILDIVAWTIEASFDAIKIGNPLSSIVKPTESIHLDPYVLFGVRSTR